MDGSGRQECKQRRIFYGVEMNHPHLPAAGPQQAGSLFFSQTRLFLAASLAFGILFQRGWQWEPWASGDKVFNRPQRATLQSSMARPVTNAHVDCRVYMTLALRRHVLAGARLPIAHNRKARQEPGPTPNH